MGLVLKNNIRIGGKLLMGSSYWKPLNDLVLDYTSRSGLDLLETKSGQNLNAKILPSCASFNGTDNGITIGQYVMDPTKNFDITISGSWDATNGRGGFGVSTSFYIGRISSTTTQWGMILKDASGNSIFGATADSYITITADVHTVTRIVNDIVAKTVSFYKDGSLVKTVDWNVSYLNNLNVGSGVFTIGKGATNFCKCKISYVHLIAETSYKWILTGIGNREFDVITGNTATWAGTSPHIAYTLNSSTDLLDNGFSIYTKDGSPDEYVPYQGSSPMAIRNNLIGSTNGLIGYQKRADYVGGASIYNYAPSLVDFDYSDSGNALLVSFNKANGTYHIDSAGMLYFDNTQTYRWRQDELANIRIYSEAYKKVGYRGIMMIKGSVVSNLVKDFQECIVYSEDKTSTDMWNTAKYCGLKDIVAKSGVTPIYDENGYLTYNALPTDLTALSICFLGDSTMATYNGYAQYTLFNMYTQFSTYNIATVGDEILLQKAKWEAITAEQKLLFDYVLVQIGLNDIAASTAQFILDYQALIDQIKADIKASCKIVVSTMTPCFGWYTDPAAQQKYLDDNIAIAGGGASPITGYNYCNTLNTTLLADPPNYMAAIYAYNELHPNNAGRLIIFNNYLSYIVR